MISVLILTLDEEVNLPECLETLTWCDDIVVVDSGSSDATLNIARAAGARIVTRDFDHWSTHRNWALTNIDFNNPWVFSIDTDERMPENLRDEIHQVVSASTHDTPNAYRLRYKNIFMGKWIKHATLYPSWTIRLYRPNKVRYEDGTVNSDPVVEGETGALNTHFEHYSFNRGIQHWIHKHNRYASFEAEAALTEVTIGSVRLGDLFNADPLQKRRARKNLFFRLPLRPLIKFFYMYVIRLGIIDGLPGLIYCVLLAFYEHLIVVKTWERRRFGPTPGQVPKSARILLVNQFYPPDTAATGQLLDDLATRLVADGHSVDVVCSKGRYDGAPAISSSPHHPSLTIHKLPTTRLSDASTLGKLINYATFQLLAMRKAKQLPRFDVCVSMTTPPYIGKIGHALKARNQTHHVLWMMDLYPGIMVAVGQISENSWLNKWLSKQTATLLKSADHVITCGKYMTEKTHALSPHTPVTTVHNWSPTEPTHASPPTNNTPLTIMYSGNPGRAHDLRQFLQAISSSPHANNFRVLIACGTAAATSLKSSIPPEHLKTTTFIPLSPRNELSSHLAKADIHLITQRPGTEGLIVPSKVYGVLANERPVLFLGPPECEVADLIRAAQCGYIVSPNQSEELNGCLATLSHSRAELVSMGKNGKTYYGAQLGRVRSLDLIARVLEREKIAPSQASPGCEQVG